MSLIIKKVKIKQSDGTFSNPIPLIADSDNVNVNGYVLTDVLEIIQEKIGDVSSILDEINGEVI